MYLDASMECSTKSNSYVAAIGMLLLWCVMFIPALFFGCKWLGQHKITVNQFLWLLTIPPLVFGFLIWINRKNFELRLQERDAFENQFIFKFMLKPYRERLQLGRENGECVYLFRCFLLSVACILPNDWQTRLFCSSFVLLLFLYLHQQLQPFESNRLNTIESCSIVSLVLIDFSIFMMNSHLELSVIETATDILVALSFVPFMAYILFLVYDNLILRVFFLVLKTVNKKYA